MTSAGSEDMRIELNMNRLTHLLLNVSNDIGARLVPELKSGEAREAAAFLQQMLLRVGGEAGPFNKLALTYLPRYKALLSSSVNELQQRDAACAAERQTAVVSSTSENCTHFQQLQAARALLAQVIGDLLLGRNEVAVEGRAAETLAILRQTAALEDLWRVACTSALATARSAVANSVATATIHDRLNPTTVTQYLRRRFPNSPDISALEVTILPGGRSKKTLFISIGRTDELPSSVVMRQDAPLSFIKTAVADEVPVLRAVYSAALPVPRVFVHESENTELGPPFMLLERIPGRTIGDYFGFSESRPAIVLELARILARLHAIDPSTVPLSKVDLTATPGKRMRAQIERAWMDWRDVSEEPSPVIESAFAWMYQECERVVSGFALIHGDAAPHNILVDGDKVSGLLDWEFTSVGDPAEDLAYIRSSVERVIPWQSFVDEYRAAGGSDVSEERLKFFRCWGEARNAVFVVNGMRAFREGNADCSQGMISFFCIPLFEDRLTKALTAAVGQDGS